MLFAVFDAARSRTERYVVDASHEERKRWSSLESREPELNQAIVDVSREDFLVGNFDLKSLFSLSVGGFYSDDCVLWLGTEVSRLLDRRGSLTEDQAPPLVHCQRESEVAPAIPGSHIRQGRTRWIRRWS